MVRKEGRGSAPAHADGRYLVGQLDRRGDVPARGAPGDQHPHRPRRERLFLRARRALAELRHLTPMARQRVLDRITHALIDSVASNEGQAIDMEALDRKGFGHVNDLSSTLDELAHVTDLLETARTVEYIQLLLKLYVVEWTTLSDVVAHIINDVLDLGYQDRDVSLGGILKNRHVIVAGIAEVVRTHSAVLQYSHYAEMRNHIVHRGRLHDTVLSELRGEWLIVALRASLSADDDEPRPDVGKRVTAALQRAGITTKIQTYAMDRAKELRIHLDATYQWLDEMDVVLTSAFMSQ